MHLVELQDRVVHKHLLDPFLRIGDHLERINRPLQVRVRQGGRIGLPKYYELKRLDEHRLRDEQAVVVRVQLGVRAIAVQVLHVFYEILAEKSKQ